MRRRVAVDLTELAPNSQNGGSGLVAASLIHQWSELAPEWEFVLLTAPSSHAELAALESRNVQRHRVQDDSQPETDQTDPVRSLARRAVAALPARARVRVKDALWRLRHARRNARVVAVLGTDLVFCPFTASPFRQANAALVVLVHDLQHVAYPSFFSNDQRLNRDQHLRDAAAHADAIVCVSEFVRQTLLAHVSVPEDRVHTIHHGLLQHFAPSCESAAPLVRLGLKSGNYLLYPANFWPHKNHLLLFEALAEYRRRRPEADVKLVCTGAPNLAMRSLQATVEHGSVLFPGYCAPVDFQALLDNCAALIFPSLYEGFGLPVLEAMARGKPVLCSRVASLPEVAGNAARYFDPTQRDDMVDAIVSVWDDPIATAARVQIGRQRANDLGTATDMASRYLRLFEEIPATR